MLSFIIRHLAWHLMTVTVCCEVKKRQRVLYYTTRVRKTRHVRLCANLSCLLTFWCKVITVAKRLEQHSRDSGCVCFRPCKKWYLYSQCDEKPLLSNRSINYTFPAKENAYPASSAVLEFSSRDQLGKYVTNNSAQSQRVKFAREYWIVDKFTSPYAVDDLF